MDSGFIVAGIFALLALSAAVLGWQSQRRYWLLRSEQQQLQERLEHIQEQAHHFQREWQVGRQEQERLRQQNQLLQSQQAVAVRELQLLREQESQWFVREEELQNERSEQNQRLQQLYASEARLQAELQEQRQSHQQRLQDLQHAGDVLRAQFAELAGNIFTEREQHFSQTSQQQLNQLLTPLKERIQAFEQQVSQSYQHEARERFSLAKELERLQQLNQRLGDEAVNLTRALQGQKVQGNWGELVLERVLEGAGLHKGREYYTQVSLKNAEGERYQPDVLIRLPGEKQVVVDAKVSLNAYQSHLQAETDADRTAALRQHVQSLRNHLKGLSVKDYQRLDGLESLDFVLLFVPIEAAFACVMEAEPSLFQEAYAQNIVIVSPTTLLVTLRVIESLWRQERQSQNALEIAEKAGALFDKFSAFVGDLDEIGNRLQQTERAYSAARNKLVTGRGNLVSRAEQLRQLGARASKRLDARLLEQAGVMELLEAVELETLSPDSNDGS